MKQLSVSEKFELIRHHGSLISAAFSRVQQPRRSDILESAERVIALAKSISKHEFGIEE
jgi:hypothetical protein